MKRLSIATAILLATPIAVAADPPRGSAGLTRLDYSVANTGALPLSCDSKLAHWFSDHLVAVAPGQAGGFTLWSDAATGAVYRLNAGGDRMPVERIWCGQQADSWASRQEIDLPRLKGEAARAASLSCAAQGATTRCTPR